MPTPTNPKFVELFLVTREPTLEGPRYKQLGVLRVSEEEIPTIEARVGALQEMLQSGNAEALATTHRKMRLTLTHLLDALRKLQFRSYSEAQISLQKIAGDQAALAALEDTLREAGFSELKDADESDAIDPANYFIGKVRP